MQKEFQLMSIHGLFKNAFSFEANSHIYSMQHISGPVKLQKESVGVICLLLEQWDWTDKAVRNIGETFGNTYTKLLNESG